MIPFIIPTPTFAGGYGRRNSSNINGTPSSQGAQNYNAQDHTMAHNTLPHNETGGIPLSDLEAGRGHDTYPPMPPPSYAIGPSTRPPSYNSQPNHSAASNNPHQQVHQQQVSMYPRPKRSRRCRCRGCCSGRMSRECEAVMFFLTALVDILVMTAISVAVYQHEKSHTSAAEWRRIHDGYAG